MDMLLKYANFEDIISAFELVYDCNLEEDKNLSIFGLYDILAFLNFGCIKETDNVITITSQYELIIWTIAYLYTPHKLVAYILDQVCEIDIDRWNNMKQILWGYHCTEPKVSIIDNDANYTLSIDTTTDTIKDKTNNKANDFNNDKKYNFNKDSYQDTKNDYIKDTNCDFLTNGIDANRMNKQIEYSEEQYDVAIIGIINKNSYKSDYIISRFYLDEGNDFALYENLLVKTSKVLKIGGILVLLTKPAWILKLWTLLDELGLHLEYDSYKVYKDQQRHPNVFVWLRFVKRDKEASITLHKKNILTLMNDNDIDRLYAHRNNLMFPYVEQIYHNVKAYVEMDQNLEYLQYFFTVETTKQLADLCASYTACLVTPSVAQFAFKTGKNPILFERDNRFRENGGCKFVKYDLNTGLTKLMQNRYRKKFDRLICDPPFDIDLEVLAKDIDELLIEKEGSIAYVIFPNKRKNSLVNAMKTKGFRLIEMEDHLCIEYAKPPKLVRINGKDSIQLYKFTYTDDRI
ncbi:MAG: hypothetical protein K0R31_125 [Clostridiales bacterium]|nr:hypothetical protein [Clostridiales bacterium]